MTKDYKLASLNRISPAVLETLPSRLTLTEDAQLADAWLVRSAHLHHQELPEDLLAIARAGAGVNNIPLQPSAELGIVVFNTPGANANAVAELVLAVMIAGSRNLPQALKWMGSLSPETEDLAGRVESQKNDYVGREIRGRSLGVIGLGAVGHRVANAAAALGMEVYGYDPYIPIEFAWKISSRVHRSEQLEDMLPMCDFVSVHVPLTDATRHLINVEAVSRMKAEAILLNYARDGLVDEAAVKVALEEGRLGGYRSDFPTALNLTFPNTIVTPHLGASTLESEENCAVMAVEELRDYLLHGNISNSVNFPAVALGVPRYPTRLVILHRNKPNALNRMTALFGEAGYNIETMVSNSRGDYACALIDLRDAIDAGFALQLQEYPDIVRVRVIAPAF